ncbi:MAG TPA: RnfH family protein [Mizugakiibacter sp.]
MSESIAVEVVYAEAGQLFRRRLTLAAGATAMQAIEASGLRAALPALAIDPDRIGVFARHVAPDTPLRDGDRVEVYRPLRVDPKEARRRHVSRPGPADSSRR